MDTLLIVITALSLAMAAGLALIVMKLVGEERRRSDARVAMLAELAAESAPTDREAEPQVVFRSMPAAVGSAPVYEEGGDDDDLDLRSPELAVAGVAELFAQPEPTSPAGRRFAVAAALAVVVFGTGFVLFSLKSDAVRTAAPVAASVPAPATAVPSLELLSLRHSQHEGSLTVTGLVQNPHGGPPISRVAAIVFLFGADGAFLASGRAALDFTTLAPGDESPFVVTVPVTGQVARYRVGFRAEDGAVIGHVDRRGPEALASRAGS